MSELPAENLLASESSPYLLQHRENPVHWRPWGRAALDEAARLDRPILLSVGYAACHWCHVMAHESFENDTIAAVMNRLFVNIKVDREERPEIDQLYMAALGAMGEQGGWPLTMFLTPAAQPFWGGTYFPPTGRYGRPGFVQVLEAIHDAWQTKRAAIQQNAETLADHVGVRLAASQPPARVTRESLSALAHGILRMTDPDRGGIRGAPKFPNAPMMQALWLGWLQSGNAAIRNAVLTTFRNMLVGGIYDHVGGGLARYSTDADWLVPHFEKMLYDNAQLVTGLVYAYAETGEDLFRRRIEEIIAWMLRDMRSAGGAFVSSYDADSEGEEGLYYTWSDEELRAVLGDDVARIYQTHELAQSAEWHGKPILRARPERDDIDNRDLLERLRQARKARVPPGRDDKILTDWNGLAIAALALAARAFERTDWLNAAQTAYQDIKGSADPAGRLPHSRLGPARLYPALSTDYAAMITAAIELYQTSRDEAYLGDARHYADMLERWHFDASRNAHYLSASDAMDVPLRILGDVDEAIPSATAQIIEALTKLAAVTGDAALHERAWQIAESAAGRAAQQQYGQVCIVNATMQTLDPMKLVLVDDPDNPKLVPVANRFPDPRRVDIIVALGSSDAPDIPGLESIPTDRAAAYLCSGQTCLPPIISADELARALKRTPADI